jgi:hypothetical protein
MEKFVQIKRSFLKDFCYGNVSSNYGTNESGMQFHFNKFGSFGTYFFNNLKDMINVTKSYAKSFSFNQKCFKIESGKNMKGRKSIAAWKDYIQPQNNTKLDKFFAVYFNSKLLSWKTSILSTKTEIENTCRVCDKTLSSKDFILHNWFCKEIQTYFPKLSKFNQDIDVLLDKIEKNKNEIYEKDNIFDNFLNIDLNSITNVSNNINTNHIIDKIVSLISKSAQNSSE